MLFANLLNECSYDLQFVRPNFSISNFELLIIIKCMVAGKDILKQDILSISSCDSSSIQFCLINVKAFLENKLLRHCSLSVETKLDLF